MAILVALVFMFGFGVLAATPDAVALDVAREEVRTLLADDFMALNEGRLTLLDVADRVVDLVATSNSAARQRILQEGAFNLYRKSDALGRAAERRVPFWINLGTEAEFKFEACPAGSFMMGCEGDRMSPNFRHRVNLPRPFWIARYQTTKRLYSTFRRVNYMSDEETLYGGMDIPHGGISRKDMDDFCAFLTYRNRDVVQEVFANLAKVFRAGCYVRDKGRFRNYLAKMLKNEMVSRFRREQVRPEGNSVNLDAVEDVANGELRVEPSFAEVEADDKAWELARHRAAVEHILSKTALSEQSRRIYRELMATGDNCAEVARRLGLPATTVRQVKSRVTRMIAAYKDAT